jgi:hypothetical protein
VRRAITPSVPNNRGLYDLTLHEFAKQPLAGIMAEYFSIGRYCWPKQADNDRDHIRW